MVVQSVLLALGEVSDAARGTTLYVDPGVGSMFIQGLIGTIAVVLAVGGAYWRKLKSHLPFRNSPRDSSEEDRPAK